jgi:hypothetical protein
MHLGYIAREKYEEIFYSGMLYSYNSIRLLNRQNNPQSGYQVESKNFCPLQIKIQQHA